MSVCMFVCVCMYLTGPAGAGHGGLGVFFCIERLVLVLVFWGGKEGKMTVEDSLGLGRWERERGRGGACYLHTSYIQLHTWVSCHTNERL